MPITESWNNSSDCRELIASPPFSLKELREIGFPHEVDAITQDAGSFVMKHLRALPSYPRLSAFINNAIRSGSYALLKETPEDIESKDIRFFLSFGTRDEKGKIIYPVSVRLGLRNPNWESIREKVGFAPGKCFVDFVESFPGLVLGPIESPEFVLPPKYFTDVSALLPKSSNGKIAIPKDKLMILNNYLFFQCDYWGVYRFIHKGDTVYELVRSPFSFKSTGIEFEDWARESGRMGGHIGN